MRKSELWTFKNAELESVIKFANTTAKSVTRKMASEYEAKRQAWDAANTSFQKSGSLDPTRLSQYSTSDEIFKKKTIKKEGQSHGLILIIDWSGSMGSIIEKVAYQYLILALYCAYTKIPFEIYTFTDNYSYDDSALTAKKKKDVWGTEEISYSSDLVFNKIASSDMSIADLTEIFAHMWSFGAGNRYVSSNYHNYLRSTFGEMGGTPLIRAQIMAYTKAKEFKNKTGVQNMNIVFLTDGENMENLSSNCVVDPFSNREYAYSEKNPASGLYNSHNALSSCVNKMTRDAGIKTCNIYIGSMCSVKTKKPKKDYCDAVVKGLISAHENWSYSLLTNIQDKLYKDIEKNYISEINNFIYYNKFIFVDKCVFPQIKETEDNFDALTAASTYNKTVLKNAIAKDFQSNLANNKALGIIGSLVNDMLVQDFAV